MAIFNTTLTYGITLHLHRYIYILTLLYLFLRCSLNSVNVFLVRIDSVSPSTLLCCGTIKQSSFQHLNINQSALAKASKRTSTKCPFRGTEPMFVWLGHMPRGQLPPLTLVLSCMARRTLCTHNSFPSESRHPVGGLASLALTRRVALGFRSA